MTSKSSIIATTASPSIVYKRSQSNQQNQGWCHGSRKVICFCILAIICPSVFISVPLLMRFVFYGSADYHVHPSDTRVIDEKISTIWCKKQTLRSNISFTAYESNGIPQLTSTERPLSFYKTLIIPDDYKEYWGFYLLEGSKYRISTCAKFKGGTLLIVKGRQHLNYCAYIGNTESTQDSDEFSDSRSDERNPSDPDFNLQSKSQQIRRNGNQINPKVISSQEEMSLLLAKIRAYVKKKPHRYYKLKEMFDWTKAINSTNSSESPTIEKSVEFNLTSTSGETLNQNETRHKIRHQKSRDLVSTENGRLVRRKRRQVDVQKNSESGEDAAFEDLSQDKDESLNLSGLVRPLDSIWRSEHSLHGGAFNMSHPDDGSDSESESSYSSSEEALAKCEGIVAMFYLKPLTDCGSTNDSIPLLFNSTVSTSGYYYFIFGSENEKTDNFMRLKFELEKSEYELPLPLTNCTNVKYCDLDLHFGSNQKLVISIPQPAPNNEDQWDEYFVLESECEPRTGLYLIFVLCLPVMILFCAFQ